MGGVLLTDTNVSSNLGSARLSASDVTEMVKQLSTEAGLPVVPPVYYIPTPEMNAFAAGMKPEKAVVAVTHGT